MSVQGTAGCRRRCPLRGAQQHQPPAGAQVDDVLVAAPGECVEYPVAENLFAAQRAVRQPRRELCASRAAVPQPTTQKPMPGPSNGAAVRAVMSRKATPSSPSEA